MSSLTDRFKELGVQIGTSGLTHDSKFPTARVDLIDALPGRWENTPSGECFVVKKEYPLPVNHGKWELAELDSLKIFDKYPPLQGISELSLSDIVFIDTETTGLSGGAGTYVFLIGAAKYSGDKILLSQFFLSDPALESAQLASLEAFSASAKVIISYNGKSFDLPRLRTRYNFHGWPDPFEGIYHLDLLHIARRLWKGYFPGLSLGDLEHRLLGLERDSLDIPGREVSEYFYNFLLTSDPDPLKNVFYHNEIDVLSLIALLDYICVRLSSPPDKNYTSYPDLVPLGKYLASINRSDQAISFLKAGLLNDAMPASVRIDGLTFLATLYKKKRQFQKALPLWIESAELGSVASHIELSKYFEHKLSDYQEAIHWTLSAIEIISNSTSPPSRSTQLHSLTHRLDRLKRKANL